MAGSSSAQQTQIDEFMRSKKDVKGQKKSLRTSEPVRSQTPSATATVKSLDLEELRKFDLDSSFGPSIDSFRLDRWKRAHKLGLDPPPHIKELILDHEDDPAYTHPVWQKHALLCTPEA